MIWLLLLAAAMSPDDMLRQIRAQVARNLRQMPNYTCTENIWRFVRMAHSKKFVHTDTMRVEVALLGGNELFAWPGGKFEAMGIDELVGARGLLSNGGFGMHLKALFEGTEARFTYDGETVEHKRKVVKFRYEVPKEASTYIVSRNSEGGRMPYHGSVTADAQTFELVSVEVIADRLPAALETRRTRDAVEYAPVALGGSNFLLPRRSELEVTDDDGNVSRNVTVYQGCREYRGESQIHFDGETPAAGPGAPAIIHLPAGIPMTLQLESAIEFDKAAIGAPVTARLENRFSARGRDFEPGARVTGRITGFEARLGGRPLQCVGLEFHAIEGAAEFHAAMPGAEDGMVCVPHSRKRIPAGLRMEWRTVE
jgi:hypothetical protein